jgi:hypothetical protein
MNKSNIYRAARNQYKKELIALGIGFFCIAYVLTVATDYMVYNREDILINALEWGVAGYITFLLGLVISVFVLAKMYLLKPFEK